MLVGVIELDSQNKKSVTGNVEVESRNRKPDVLPDENRRNFWEDMRNRRGGKKALQVPKQQSAAWYPLGYSFEKI